MDNNIKILPSIASANQLHLQDEMDRVKGHKYLHIDIEDGNFLPNITFGMKTIKSIMNLNSFTYDVHLLVTNPLDYLDELIALKPEAISFHIEAHEYPLVLLNKIRQNGIKAGLAFNFKTDLKQSLIFSKSLDYIIVMCGEPDSLGNQFNDLNIERIKEIRSILPENIEIWVDGGISETNIFKLKEAGANGFVMGRAIWSKEDPLKFINSIE